MDPINPKRLQSLKRHYATDRCTYCGVVLTVHNTTRDHIEPRAQGGSKNATHNLTLACMQCNTSKGDMTPSAWGRVLTMALIGAIRRRS